MKFYVYELSWPIEQATYPVDGKFIAECVSKGIQTIIYSNVPT